MTDETETARYNRLLLLVLAVFVVARVASLDRYDLWFDELFSVGVGLGSWGDTLARSAADQTNPPLFYLLVKAWTLVAPVSAVPLRVLPLLFGLAGAGALLALTRILAMSRLATLAVLAIAAVSPQLVFYSVELRAYSLLFLLSTIALVLTLRLVLKPTTDSDTGHRAPDTVLLWLTVVNTALVYTHYFGWFTVLAEGVVVLLVRRDLVLRALASGTVTGLLFLPWALAVRAAGQASGDFGSTISWVERPGGLSVVEALGAALGGTDPWASQRVGGLVVLAILLLLVRSRREPRVVALLAFMVVPLVSAFAASWLTPRSIWVDRNFIGSAGAVLCMMVLASNELSRIGKNPPGWRGSTLIVAGVMAVELMLVMGAGGAKLQWSALAERIQQGSEEGARVYAFEGFTAIPLQYYLGRYAGARHVTVIQSFDSLRAGPGWVVVRDGAWPGTGELPVALGQHGHAPGDWVRLTAPGQEIQAAGYR